MNFLFKQQKEKEMQDYESDEAKMILKKCKKYVIERTLLRKACKEGRLDLLEYYYEKRGFKLEYCRTVKDYKLLEEASRWGHIDCVTYLIKERGFDHSVHNYLPIRMAIKYNHLDLVKMYSSLFPQLFQNWEDNISVLDKYNITLNQLIHINNKINHKNAARTKIFLEAAKNPNPTISKWFIEQYKFDPYMHVMTSDFFKFNDYIKVFIATKLKKGAVVHNIDNVKLNYLVIKGFSIKLMIVLNGKLGPFGSNRYLITEILEKELGKNVVNKKEITNSNHVLFSLTK